MTLRRTRLAPGRGSRNERRTPWALLAGVIGIAGVAVNLWRPLAEIGPASTPLTRFTADVEATVAAYREPVHTGAALELAVLLLVPMAFVLSPTGRRAVRWLAGPLPTAKRGALVAVAIAVATSLARLPLDVWIGFVHNGRWGFRTAPLGLWVRDWILAEGLAWLAAAVAGAGLVAAIRRWRRSWHWRLVPAALALTAALAFVFPVAIAPLFLPTEPLPAGAVRDEVEEVLAEAGVTDVPIRLGNASLRTTRANAFFAGLGPTREVVLYDNLLELPPDRVGLVVAHELAHRQHDDILRGVLLSGAGLLIGLVLLRRVLDSRDVQSRMDARTPWDPRLVAVAAVIAALGQVVSLPVMSWFSRRAEAAADERAMALTGDPTSLALVSRAFTVRDLVTPDPSVVVQFLWGTHPTVEQRIRAAAGFAEAAGVTLPDLERARRLEQDYEHPLIGVGP